MVEFPHTLVQTSRRDIEDLALFDALSCVEAASLSIREVEERMEKPSMNIAMRSTVKKYVEERVRLRRNLYHLQTSLLLGKI